ncbi:flavodoxin domain-containing protein [Comamonadaceae bacterium M7527]|nr:flavodoxin domain-containing protein [Comamonadaceae bacterium M7527]
MSTPTHLHILVATTGDRALNAAKAAAQVLSATFTHIEVSKLTPDDGIAVFGQVDDSANKLFIVCSSTHGSGDVPDNAQAFLASFDLEPTFLGHVRYGLMALGDSSYGATYAAGAKLLDAKLQDLGAQRLGLMFEHDASGLDDANETAAQWATEWAKHVVQAAAT